MPFTLAHPAAVLPLRPFTKRWLSWPALVIGSLAPDLEYFLLLRLDDRISHTFSGSILFGLPVGLALLVLYERLLERPVILLLPESHRRALWPRTRATLGIRSPRPWLVAAASILVGAWLHLALDAFTHEGSWGVRMLPWLDHSFGAVAGHNVSVVNLLQYAGSVLGMGALLASYLVWVRHLPRVGAHVPRLRPAVHRAVLALLPLVPAPAAITFAWGASRHPDVHGSLRLVLAYFSIGYVSAAALVLVAFALSVHLFGNRLVST